MKEFHSICPVFYMTPFDRFTVRWKSANTNRLALTRPWHTHTRMTYLRFFQRVYTLKYFFRSHIDHQTLWKKLNESEVWVASHEGRGITSMPTQQYTNTNHISIDRYRPVVSIILKYTYMHHIQWKSVLPRKNRQHFGTLTVSCSQMQLSSVMTATISRVSE